jgi:hypothetical protein
MPLAAFDAAFMILFSIAVTLPQPPRSRPLAARSDIALRGMLRDAAAKRSEAQLLF